MEKKKSRLSMENDCLKYMHNIQDTSERLRNDIQISWNIL